MGTGKKGLLRRILKILKFEHWHLISAFLIVYDLVAVNGAYFLALWLRFDCKFSNISGIYFDMWYRFLPIYSLFCLFLFFLFRMYNTLWRFASFTELLKVITVSMISSVFHIVGMRVLFMFFETNILKRMPISYYVFGTIFQFMLLIFVRFSYRFITLEKNRLAKQKDTENTDRIMLIGAGSAGEVILSDINSSNKTNGRICCIIDDNSNKWGRFIDNIPIVGGRNDILVNVEKYKIQKIFLAIPSATAEQRRDILNICKETDCELKTLPGIYQLANGKFDTSTLQDVNIEDLLGREPIKANMDEVFEMISGKVILVTGGGGSIGSELCRQIANHNPKQLIIFDIYENNAHEIRLELEDKHPDLDLKVLIGSVRDSRRLDQIFKTFKPEIVYHAAAHKHVPLMEDSPCESMKNNAIGTYKTAYAAMMNGAKRFVLISTDKAVNPTNIMGASKRICEMVIQSFDRKIKDGQAFTLPCLYAHSEDTDGNMNGIENNTDYPKTEFVAVRFGNVLGSNGSVVPRFKEQIAKGGPVTVTHPDIIRYFMTIPEAASLVLQAGTYAKGGEIFVLDMGSPVKIDTLARNLIKLSGLRPDIDIKITYSGLRPGEKLYEEKLMDEENMGKTPNNLIHIGCPIPFDTDKFLNDLQTLMEVSYNGDEKGIYELTEKIVTTFHPVGN